MIDYANPVYTGCTLLMRETNVKLIGTCDGLMNGFNEIARALGLDFINCEFQAPGINRHVWLTQVLYRGEFAYPIFDEWIEKKAEKILEKPVS